MSARYTAQSPAAVRRAWIDGHRAALAGCRADALERERRVAWQDDPERFALDALGWTPWHRQAEIMRAVAEHSRVAVRSGHKVGKSATAAVLALWWCTTRERGRVVMTAPTHHQVRRVLWRELGAQARRARIDVPVVPQAPNTGVQWADGRSIVGFATDETERMAGISGDQLLFLLDEGSGIPQSIYEAVEGCCAGGGKIVAFGNPTQQVGWFASAFREQRALWHAMHVSSLESPNVTGVGEPVAGLATREYVQHMLAEYGESSPVYAVRVLGDFPAQSSCAVVPIALLEDAVHREQTPAGPAQIGVDVARFGDDDSVVAVRRGHALAEIVRVHGIATTELVGRVVALVERYAREGTASVVVDETGLGAGVVDQLRQAEATARQHFDVTGITVSSCATDDSSSDLRSELWFGVERWLRAGGALPDDARLLQELAAPEYAFDAHGRRRVESKDRIRQKIGRSPDTADAVALAVYERSRATYRDAVRWRSPWRWAGVESRGF